MRGERRRAAALLLCAALVFSMHSGVFAEEIPVSPDTGESTMETEVFAAPAETAEEKGAFPVSWNTVDNYDICREFFRVKDSTEKTDRLLDGKKVEITRDNKDQDCLPGIGEEGTVSSCVIPVDEAKGIYLMVAYSVLDHGFRMERGAINGKDDLVDLFDRCDLDDLTGHPVVTYCGRKYDSVKKASAKKANAIDAAAALIQYDSKTGKAVLLYNTASGNDLRIKKIKAKNNLYATVSRNGKYGAEKPVDPEKDAEYEPITNAYLKAGAYPYFTMNIAAAGSLKEYAKAIKAGLKKQEFRFEIRRAVFADASIRDDVEEREKILVKQKRMGYDADSFGTTFLDYKVNGKVKFDKSGTKGSFKVKAFSGFQKNRKYAVYNLKDAKKAGGKGDYYTEVITVSGDQVLLLHPNGNFEGDSAAFRNYTVETVNAKGKTVKKNQVRDGAYRSKDYFYVNGETSF